MGIRGALSVVDAEGVLGIVEYQHFLSEEYMQNRSTPCSFAARPLLWTLDNTILVAISSALGLPVVFL